MQHQQHRRQRGFVVHKLPQLGERPAIAVTAFPFRPGLLVGAVLHARQIFQDQHRLSCVVASSPPLC